MLGLSQFTTLISLTDLEPAWLAASAAVAGAGAAWWAAINGARTLKRAREDSKEKSRPMLAAELRDVPHTKGKQILVVRNYGTTIARNIHVDFVPPIPDPMPDVAHESVTPFLKARFSKPISILTPGMELDNLWFVGVWRDGVFENSEPTPDQFTVTLRYQGSGGDVFEDEFPLDVDVIRKRTYVTSSAHPDSQRKEMLQTLKGIKQAIQNIDKR